MNHYPRHIGDWMRDTAHLTEIEECVYSRLLDRYYSSEAPLPTDIGQCCRLVRAASAATRKAVASVLREFFTLAEDGWHQKRADMELAAYRERSESAKRSVNARWEKRNTNVDTIVHTNVSKTYDERNTSRKPVTSNHKPVEAKAARKRAETPIPDDFGISDRVAKWAAGKGYGDLPRYLEIFIGRNRASGKTYLDWDDALMNAIREDWYELRGKPLGGQTKADKIAAVAESMHGNLTREINARRDDIQGEFQRSA